MSRTGRTTHERGQDQGSQAWHTIAATSYYRARMNRKRIYEVMNEANEEHHLVHVLIAELKELAASDETFKAEFTVLGELVKPHVKEEEAYVDPQLDRVIKTTKVI